MELNSIFQLFIIYFGFLKAVHIIQKPYKMSILDILIFSGSIYFGLLPFAITVISGGSDYISTKLSVLTYTTVALFFVGSILVMLAEKKVHNRRGGRDGSKLFNAFASAERVGIFTIVIVFAACIFSKLYIAMNYGILFSGTKTEANILALPYIIVMLMNFIQLFEWGLGVWASWTVIDKNKVLIRIVAATILILLFFLMFMEGRRWMFAFIAQFFCIALLKLPRFKFRMAFSALLVASALTLILFPAFLKIRDAHTIVHESGNALIDLKDAITYFSDNPADLIDLNSGLEYLSENLRTRGSVVGFLIDILDRQEIISPMNGDAMISALKWAIPQFLYKEKVLQFQTEQLIQFHYGMRLEDVSITWVAVGAADFGALGGLFIGICFCVLLVFLTDVCVRFSRKVPFISLCLIGGIINFILVFEQDPSAIIVIFRDSCVLFFIFAIVQYFNRKDRVLIRQKLAVCDHKSIRRHSP